MSGFIKTILAAKIPITFFYGDTDAVCNYLLGQKFVEGLGLKVNLWKILNFIFNLCRQKFFNKRIHF